MSIKVLVPGFVTEKKLNLLLQLTKIKSENKINALYSHLVQGKRETTAAILNDVDINNFYKVLHKLEKVAVIAENIKEDDLHNSGLPRDM